MIAEPLHRLGAAVTAIDAAAGAVDAARAHAALHDLTIDYRCMTAEALAAEGARFDVVVASEVLEHVASLHAFCAAVASLLKPEGAFLATTINRTTRALAWRQIGGRVCFALGTGRHPRLAQVRAARRIAKAPSAAMVW